MWGLYSRLNRVFGFSRARVEAIVARGNRPPEDVLEIREFLMAMAIIAEYGRPGAILLAAGYSPEEVDDLARRGPGPGWDATLRMAMRVVALENAQGVAHRVVPLGPQDAEGQAGTCFSFPLVAVREGLPSGSFSSS